MAIARSLSLTEGLNVAVRSRNEFLPMYDDPGVYEDGGSEEPVIQNSYIEANTGACFGIHLSLSRNFTWGGCDAVRVVAVYDGDEPGWNKDLRRDSRWTESAPERCVKFTTLPQWSQSSQQWERGDLSFGALEISTMLVENKKTPANTTAHRRDSRCSNGCEASR